MELLNATGMQAGYTLGMQPNGRELLVVAVKGTFTIPKDGEKPELVSVQAPLVMADVFTGEPGFSAPLYESDYPPHKPRCDLLLNGSAYAPEGKPATTVPVSLQVGPISKSFSVVGDRVWKNGLVSVKATPAKPFTKMPISYDKAFGGVDVSPKNPEKRRTYPTNPVGAGYHHYLDAENVDGKPLPNIEELGNPVTSPTGNYRPMALGPIGRNWQPRVPLAGTYDQHWLDKVFPFLPTDFKEDYYQAAPADQQMPYPKGGERAVLINLTPEGRTIFHLPTLAVPIVFFLKSGDKKETVGVIDTIIIEPDLGQFILVWRSSLPLRKNLFEVAQVIAGEMSPAWYRARELGKTYYRSLGELVAANRLVEVEEEAT